MLGEKTGFAEVISTLAEMSMCSRVNTPAFESVKRESESVAVIMIERYVGVNGCSVNSGDL